MSAAGAVRRRDRAVCVPVPRAAELPPAELEARAAGRARSEFLMFAAEHAILETSRDRSELGELLDRIAHAVQTSDVHAWPELRLELEARIPAITGGVMLCNTCGQVGRATEIVANRLRWSWSGRTVHGEAVHHSAVTQARLLGDVPPRLCPDHELAARMRGELPTCTVRSGARAELERRRVR